MSAIRYAVRSSDGSIDLRYRQERAAVAVAKLRLRFPLDRPGSVPSGLLFIEWCNDVDVPKVTIGRVVRTIDGKIRYEKTSIEKGACSP